MPTKIDKKKNTDSVPVDSGNTGGSEFSGIDTKLISELNRIGILDSIKNVFGDKAADFIRLHCYLNENGKLVVKSLNKQFRDYVIGLPVWDISFGSMKYAMINKFVVIKIANHDSVFESIENGMSKFSDYVIAKQKNGSFRLRNINRNDMEFEIQ